MYLYFDHIRIGSYELLQDVFFLYGLPYNENLETYGLNKSVRSLRKIFIHAWLKPTILFGHRTMFSG